MRLIDADVLEKDISVSYSMTDDYGIQTGYAISMKLIEDAPTIEPRCETCEAFNKTRLLIPQPERKKGKWIHDGKAFESGCDWMHCSECGYKDVDVLNTRTNFCPNCGAEMET